MPDVDSIRTVEIGWPSAVVCLVTSRVPSIASAKAETSSIEPARLTPPAFPRPPAWTCALTIHASPPSAMAADRASTALVAGRPRGAWIP